MADWMKPQEAMNYFGVDLETLESMVLEYDMDVDVDGAGEIIAINAADCREPLFKEHAKKHGYRPDSPEHREKAEKADEKREEKEKEERDQKKDKLVQRVSMRYE